MAQNSFNSRITCFAYSLEKLFPHFNSARSVRSFGIAQWYTSSRQQFQVALLTLARVQPHQRPQLRVLH